MHVTLKEIQDYWTRYCERHGLDSTIFAEGMRLIALNQDYWADHTMRELRDMVTRELGRHGIMVVSDGPNSGFAQPQLPAKGEATADSMSMCARIEMLAECFDKLKRGGAGQTRSAGEDES